MTNLLEHFKCPICLEVPDGKVFQCKNGHMFCHQCSPRLKTCPQCRAVLGTERIRNRTLERLMDVVEFNCPNKQLGCGKILRRHEISAHLKYCKFEPFYFCKLIGFQSCSYNAIHSLKTHESTELLSHLREAHPDIIGKDVVGTDETLRLTYKGLISRTGGFLERGTVTVWTPQLVSYSGSEEGKETVLLFLCQASEVTMNAAWICLSMTDHYPNVVEYKVTSRGGGSLLEKEDLLAPQITWKAPVMPFKDIEKELESFALRISFCVLNSLRKGKGKDLEMSINLVTQKNVKVQDDQGGGQPVGVEELITFTTNSPLSSQHIQRKRLSCPYIQYGTRDGEDEDRDDELVFENVYCNECGLRPMTKIRYKCLQCIDYDLCRRCMDRGELHSHHVFARIQSRRQNDYLNWKHRLRLMKGKSSYI